MRWQFSLRTFLIAVALFSVPLGFLGKWLFDVQQQQMATARLHSLGCRLDYDDGVLTEVRLGGQHVSDQTVAEMAEVVEVHFPTVHTLELSSKSITDASMEHVKRIPRLGALILNWTSISDTGLASLRGKRLGMLGLAGTQVKGDGLKHVASSDLQKLYLQSSPITEEALVHVGHFKKLRSLNLSNTNVSDAGLAHLSSLDNLVMLNLDQTKMSDVSIDHLCRLKSLGSVKLEKTNVSAQGTRRLMEALPTCWVISKHNPGGGSLAYP